MFSRALRRFAIGVSILTFGATNSEAAQYDIDLQLTTPSAYQALSLNVAYGATGGAMNGGGGSVSCAANSALGTVSSFNDNDGNATLAASLITTGTVAGPVVLFTCTMTDTNAPTVGQFTVTVTDYDTSIVPTIAISRIQLR